jgi:hypothetical protein
MKALPKTKTDSKFRQPRNISELTRSHSRVANDARRYCRNRSTPQSATIVGKLGSSLQPALAVFPMPNIFYVARG